MDKISFIYYVLCCISFFLCPNCKALYIYIGKKNKKSIKCFSTNCHLRRFQTKCLQLKKKNQLQVSRNQFNFIVLWANGERNMGWSVGIIRIIISNSRVGKKSILKKSFSMFLPLLSITEKSLNF